MSLIFKVDKKLKYISVVFLIVVVITPFILVAAKNTPLVSRSGTLNRLASISLTDITTETRLLTWQTGWKGMIASPKSFLIGYGPENYYYVFNKNFPVEIYKDAGSRIWFDRAHNIVLDVGVTTGIIGLAIYLSILILAAYSLYRNYKNNHSVSASFILISLLIAYFIQNFFVFDTLLTDLLFYFVLAFIVFLSTTSSSAMSEDDGEEEGEETEEDTINYRPVNYIYAAVVIIIFLAGAYAINVKTLKANNYIYQGLVAVNSDVEYEIAFEFLKLAIDEAIPGRFEARQQLANFVNGLSNRSDIPPEKMTGMINLAAQELRKSVDEEPKNIRHYIFLSTFYNASTRFDRSNSQKVIDLLEPDGIALSPTRPHIYYEIGQAYAFLTNFEKSFEYFKKGAELAPQVIDDRWNMLTIAIVFKQFDLADEVYQMMIEELDWQPGIEDHKRLVALYSRVNNFSKMLEYQEVVIALEKTAPNYAQLAAIHAKLGNNAEARLATQEAIAIDPDFIKEGEEFMRLLDSGQLLGN